MAYTLIKNVLTDQGFIDSSHHILTSFDFKHSALYLRSALLYLFPTISYLNKLLVCLVHVDL